MFVAKSTVAGHDNTTTTESDSAIEPLHDYVEGCAADTDKLLIGQGQLVPGDTATAFVADFLWSLGLEVHVPHHLSPDLRHSLETARVH